MPRSAIFTAYVEPEASVPRPNTRLEAISAALRPGSGAYLGRAGITGCEYAG